MALTPEQQKTRSQGIGGSEIAAVLGLNPYCTPLDIWARKTGRVGDQEASEPMILGTHIGPGIAKAYAEISGRVITHIGAYERTHRHPELPLAVATPDGLIRKSKHAAPYETLECKRPNPRNWERWGEPGTDQVPEEVYLQAMWTAGVVGMSGATIVMPAYSLQSYYVPFDRELFGVMYCKAERFWEDHVCTGRPPPAVPRDGRLLSQVYHTDAGDSIAPSDEMRDLAIKYDVERESEKACKDRKAEIAVRIKEIMEEAAVCEGSDYKVTWKSTKARIDWKRACIDASIETDSYTRPGTRPLKITVKETR